MNPTESTAPGMEVARERVSRLSAAILRISASLDPATVLREVVESARALTGARYGIITTVDESGQPADFITSGFTEEEHARYEAWQEGRVLFEHFRDLEAPLRVADLPAYVRALGFSTELIPAKPFQGTPMRHRGEHVGIFFLGGKEGADGFTAEDEELLVLFASQAATAIVNARIYRDERKARADLEALVETSPVGVVVLDATTGRLVSFNREARRLVDGLHAPGFDPEQLLKILTCRRGDGSEIALDDFPLSEALRTGETVRAEEMVLSVPDGRSVTALINATPIRSDDGAVTSVVVTMQDLAPLEELERTRVEFVGLVSHELRAPLAAIKGSAATVRGASRALDPAEIRQFFRIIEEHADQMDALIGDLLDAGRIETGTLTVDPEPTEVAELVDRARNTFLSGGGRHDLVIDLPPQLPRVAADRQRIVQVLGNLFANAAHNAPESSAIRIDAARDGVHVAISVSDQGRGIASERLPHLFRRRVGVHGGREPAGAGLGLSICKGLVEAHGGRIRAESDGDGRGARFTFTLPAAGSSGAEAGGPGGGTRASRDGRERRCILVVDDDPQMLRYVRDALASGGYSPVVTADPLEVSALIEANGPSLVLLDLLLPGTDGIELMETVPELADLPVIFISAYGREETVARALQAGAADYVVKPFSPTELLTRVGAALRGRADPEPFVLGDLAIDYERRRVSVAGKAVHLTATEFELLRLLSVNAGRVMTSKSLLRQLWGEGRGIQPNQVRNFVRKLRGKLGENARRPTWIFNVRGVGYRMARPDQS
ncbi:MAG: response regulator [Defluviicoccus sp.]|nr:response regulator [Defluviicoccus sp.]MDE0274345.1 response regulator [Defluviicoccus sp.]